MLMHLAAYCRRRSLGVVASLAAACAGAPLAAQGMQTIDPNSAIDGDLSQPQASSPESAPVYDGVPTYPAPAPAYPEPATPAYPAPAPAVATSGAPAATTDDTWKEDDLIGAAEGVFGKGAKGLAG